MVAPTRMQSDVTAGSNCNCGVTVLLRHALVELVPLPGDTSRRAFVYVDGIW